MTEEMFSEKSVKLVGMGRQNCEDMHAWGPGIRSCYIIHYVIKGAGYLVANHKKYRVKAGESFLTKPYTLIEYFPDEEEPWEYTWVDFVGEQVENWMAHTGFKEEMPVCSVEQAEKLLPLFCKLLELDIYHQQKNEACGILLSILGIYLDIFPIEHPEDESEDEKRMELAVLLIRNHYHQSEFHIQMLCEMLHISRVTLYRHFVKKTGISPKQYLLNYRIEQAKLLLAMGTSVKNTAASCGFEDVFYFSRVFKTHTGVAPSRYADKKE
ncbi:MAG: AraC family transcriptional regulator [Roseburia sp.]